MISLIAAIGLNNEIGKDNKLIWKLPEDLKNFKKITNNHKVIMGYNTYLSIGGVLPSRDNVILVDHNVDINNARVYTSIDELINKEIDNEEVFIIGGASLYNYFINSADKLYLTEIKETCSLADTYFPNFDKSKYIKKSLGKIEENNIKYELTVYERINK